MMGRVPIHCEWKMDLFVQDPLSTESVYTSLCQQINGDIRVHSISAVGQIGTFEKTTNLVNRAHKRYALHGADDQVSNNLYLMLMMIQCNFPCP